MKVSIACIVEGDGDVAALPVLLRRIAAETDVAIALDSPRPIRVPRDKIVKSDELEHRVVLAVQKSEGLGGVLILIDADTDCPSEMGPKLLARARIVRSNVPIAVVLAKHEFETWFLAAAESLRGKRGLPLDFRRPDNPEAIRGAKEHLAQFMPRGYSERLDQPAFADQFSFEEAKQHSRSFRKCYKEVRRLLDEVREKETP
jgi:hypothetical protein